MRNKEDLETWQLNLFLYIKDVVGKVRGLDTPRWVNKSISLKNSLTKILERKSNKHILDPRETLKVRDLEGLGSIGKLSGSQGGKETTESPVLEVWSSIDLIVSSLI